MWRVLDPAAPGYRRAWWASSWVVCLLGVVLGAAQWSLSTVVVGVALDTLAVSIVWALILALALPAGTGRPLHVASVLTNALFLVGCGLALAAFASLSLVVTGIGAVVFLALSPVSLAWLERRRQRHGSPPPVPTGARS